MSPIQHVKDEIRVVGWDDAPSDRDSIKVPLVGAITRGRERLEGVLQTSATYDGVDATRAIAYETTESPHAKQLRVILLDGITFAGLNVVDLPELSKQTKLPVLAVTKNEPNLDNLKRALQKVALTDQRWKTVNKAGEVCRLEQKGNSGLWFQYQGMSEKIARRVLDVTIQHGSLPEPIRLAHLIATAMHAE
ncbi:MAG: DUF99 family protein [Candidatus Acetothermia bacterium]